jgi:hypothetical protein
MLIIASAAAVHGLVYLAYAIRGRIAYGSSIMHIRNEAAAGIMLLIFGGAAAGLLAILLSNVGHVAFAVVSIALGVWCWRFFALMPAPTREGRKALDSIEAFKRSLTESSPATPLRSQSMRTVEDCERCLPYAVALDTGYAWSAQTNLAVGSPDEFVAAWYQDGEMQQQDDPPLYLVRSIGNELTAAIGREQPPAPKSGDDDDFNFFGGPGSGFGGFGGRGFGGGGLGGFGGGGFGGGGGFSGGGSGGGGGGGW